MTTTVPVVLDRLIDLLAETDPKEWPAIREQLVAQCPADSDADELFGAATDAVMHNANCVDARNALRESLRQIGVHAADAQRYLGELRGPSLFDVEYAEGMPGRDLEELLVQLGRTARLAIAVNDGVLRAYEPKVTVDGTR